MKIIRYLLSFCLFRNITSYCIVCQKRKTHHSAKDCLLVNLYEKLCKVTGISCANCKHNKLVTLDDQLACHGCYIYEYWEEDK